MGKQTGLCVKQHRKRYDTEHWDVKQGAKGRRPKPKIKGRGKGQDRSGRGKVQIKQEIMIQCIS